MKLAVMRFVGVILVLLGVSIPLFYLHISKSTLYLFFCLAMIICGYMHLVGAAVTANTAQHFDSILTAKSRRLEKLLVEDVIPAKSNCTEIVQS